MKKLLSYLICIFIIIFIVIFIYIKLNNKFQVAPFGVCIFQVSSNSMFPHFSIGDYIIIKKQDNYEIEDIITYKDKNNCLITHRIIEKYKNDLYITKGDANNIQDDEYVEKTKIYGKVFYILKNPLKGEVNEENKLQRNN